MLNFYIGQTIKSASGSAVSAISLNASARSETANAQEELIESIDKMIFAISSNQSVQTMADKLAEKTWWAAFKGTVSGANDIDLASMVKNLGGSLETTQTVVQVMLRLQTQKDHVLRGFHSALVDKIIKIQTDTKTLDINQRTTALDIVSALRDQVEDQLRHYEAIDRHELQFQEIDDILVKSASVEVDFRESLNALDDQLTSLKKSDDYLSRDVETLQKSLRNEMVYRRQELTSATSNFASHIDQQVALMTAFEVRLTQIELKLAHNSTWPARVLRHSFGLIGILIGVAGLAISIHV